MTQILDPSNVPMGDANHPVIAADADVGLDQVFVTFAQSVTLNLGAGQSALSIILGADSGDIFSPGSELIFEQTLDGNLWWPIYLYPRAGGAPTGGLYASPPSGQFFGPGPYVAVGSCAGALAVRARASQFVTGDSVTLHMRASIAAPGIQQVAVVAQPSVTGPTSIQGNVANGNIPGSTKPVWMSGWDGANTRALLTDLFGALIVNAQSLHGTGQLAGSHPFLMGGSTGGISGQVTNIKTDANGVLYTNINGTPAVSIAGVPAVSISGTPNVIPTREASAYHHFNSAGSTLLKNGAGRLARVTIGTVATNASITLYDNTAGSGAAIAVIDCHTATKTLEFDAAFSTGLFAVVAGSPDVTVMFE